MFLKLSTFKGLLKLAYKGDVLRLGAGTDGIYIYGSSWAIKIVREHLQKQEKAAIIEYSGELPEIGEFWKVHKDGNQAEMSVTVPFEVFANAKMTSAPAVVTGFMFDDQVLSQHTQNGIKLFPASIVNNISINHINENIETAPEGPFYSEKMDGAYWRNNIMILYVMAGYQKNKEFWKKLEKIDLAEAD